MNHIKTLISLDINVGCIDLKKNILDNVKSVNKNIKCFKSFEESLVEDYDGYVIATPPSTHSELAKFGYI